MTYKVNRKQIAGRLGISLTSVRKLIDEKKLTAIGKGFGGAELYDLEQVKKIDREMRGKA